MPGVVEKTQAALDAILRMKMLGPRFLELLTFMDASLIHSLTRNVTFQIPDQGESDSS